MKKILLTMLLIVPALMASAQGPIKMWNDKLDDFIEAFNQVTPTLEQLYSDNGIDSFAFTYYDPETGNVVMEASIPDSNDMSKVSDDLMANAKSIAVKHLSNKVKSSARIKQIINEFNNKNTNIVLLYGVTLNDDFPTKQIVISPKEIK